MNIIDYIVYRLYTVYQKHKDPGRFSTFVLLLYMNLIALVFLDFYIDILVRDEYFTANALSNSGRFYVFLSVIVINIFLFYLRYTKKRIEELKKRFKSSSWNKIIPIFLILMLPIFEIIAGIGIYYLLKKYY